MRIPKETIEAIRERTNIVEVIGQTVTLKRRGSNHLGLCPFHNEKTPSFNVLPARQIFHCFGCGEGGDVFKFVMKTQGLTFTEAVKELAEPVGITIEERELTFREINRLRRRASLHDACAEASRWFQNKLMTSSDGAAARRYLLEERGITLESAKAYGLGFAPAGWDGLINHLQGRGFPADLAVRASLAKRSERTGGLYDVFRDRLLFPILDHRDRPIAFGGRRMGEDGPKYLNSPESEIYEKSSTLYGLSWARTHIQRKSRALVVEGYFDVLSLVQAGFGETVATCGTALTPAHVERLRRLTSTVIALFDGDEAGARAAEKSLPMFLDAGLEPRRLELPDGMDPDDFVRERGAEAFERLLNQARPLLEVVLERLVERHGTTPQGRQRAVEDAAPLLRKLPHILRSDMLIRASDILRIREATLREVIGRPEAERQRHEGHGGARWVGDPDLNRLLWLLLHFPEQVNPIVQQTDPSIVTEREDVRWCIANLLAGTTLPEILNDLDDPDVARLLQSMAVQDGPETVQTATDAARRALAKLELQSIEAQLLALHRKNQSASSNNDLDMMREIIRAQISLRQRREELKPLVARGT